jgi:hypothetical protein
MISGPRLATKARLLSFNRTQSRVITGLLTGQNILRRHLYLMGLRNNPTCRKCGNEKETSDHILCECEALASLRDAHMDSFFLDHADVINISIGAIWNFGKGTGLLYPSVRSWGTKGLFSGPGTLGPEGLKPTYYSILFVSVLQPSSPVL